MQIQVTKNKVILPDNYIINKGEYHVNVLEFLFSEEYTNEMVKKAIFVSKDESIEQVIINNQCHIPNEMLNIKSFELRVYAYEIENGELVLRYSPTYAMVYLREGSYKSDTSSEETITPTQFEQFEQALNNGLNELESGLEEVSNVDIDASKSGNTATVTITDRQGTEKSVEIFDGNDYVITENDYQEIANIIVQENNFLTSETDPTVPIYVKNITQNDIVSWNNKSNFSGSYNDLTNKPTIPNKTSDLTNDSGFITKLVNNLSNYYLKSETYTKTEVNNLIGQIASMQFQLVNELPLTGNSSYIYLVPSSNPTTQNIKDEYIWVNNAWEQIGSTQIDLTGYATENWVNSQISNFLTSTQIQNLINASLDGYVQDSNYVHTDNNYTSAEKTKLANLEEENEALYNDHPDITATGTNVTLNGTGDLKMSVDVGGNSTQETTSTSEGDEYDSPSPEHKQDINNVEGDVVVISKNSNNTKSNTVTFPLSQGQKLMLGDTLEDDGVYHKRAKVTANELKTVTTYVNQLTDFVRISFMISDLTNKVANIIPNGLCNYLKFLYDYTNESNHFYARGNVIYVFLEKTLLSSLNVTGVRAFLDEYPDLEIEYDLAEETLEDYTTTQQTAYNKLKEMHSYYDLTYVIGTSDNAQPILTAQAKKSLKVMQNEIDSIESRLSVLE